MCVPVRARSSRRKCTSRRRVGTSCSYVVPFTLTLTTCSVTGVVDTSSPRFLGSLQDGPHGRRLGEAAPVIGRRMNVRGRIQRVAEAFDGRPEGRLVDVG